MNSIEEKYGIIYLGNKHYDIEDLSKLNIPKGISFSSNYLGGEDVSLNGSVNVNGTMQAPKVKGNIKLIEYKLKPYMTVIKNADII